MPVEALFQRYPKNNAEGILETDKVVYLVARFLEDKIFTLSTVNVFVGFHCHLLRPIAWDKIDRSYSRPPKQSVTKRCASQERWHRGWDWI